MAWTPRVTLRREGSRAPLCWVHPVGGTVFCYEPLTRLTVDRPVYAFQCPLEGEAPQTDRMLELASRYVDALGISEGGLYLAGWSLGGAIAWEMAQILQARGRVVSGVLMLDSPVPTRAMPDASETLAWFLRDLNGGVGLQTLPDATVEEQLEALAANSALPRGIDAERAQQLFEVFRANVRAFYQWEPSKGSTPAVMLAARDEAAERAQELRRQWEPLATGGLKVLEVPGNHYTLLEARHLPGLSEHLRRWLSPD